MFHLCHFLSGPDGSRHSSDQQRQPQDVNSKIRIIVRNLCPGIFVLPKANSQDVEFCVFAVFEFLSHLPRNSRAPRGRKFRFVLSFLSFVAISCSGLVWRHLRSRDTSGTLKSFRPTQTGLCKFGWVWSSLKVYSQLGQIYLNNFLGGGKAVKKHPNNSQNYLQSVNRMLVVLHSQISNTAETLQAGFYLQ